MRKILSFFIAAAITISLVYVPALAKTSLKLSRSSVELPIDYYTTLTVKGASGTVEWSSEDDEIAYAEPLPYDGASADIIGKKTGETYIYAKADGKTLKCKVTVKQSFISVSTDHLDIKKGNSEKIHISVAGSKKLAVKNSNENICSVSYSKWNGNDIDITVKAIGSGDAVLNIYASGYYDSTAVPVSVSIVSKKTVKDNTASQEITAFSKAPEVFPLSSRLPTPKPGDYEKYYSRMEKAIANYPHNCEVLLYSYKYGRLFSHNTKQTMMGASMIKVPYVYFCCTQIEKGKHSLDEKVVYKEEHYYGSMGKIQYSEFGSEWTIRTLIDYTLRYSDNVAYFMLMSVFGKDDFNKMAGKWGNGPQLGERNYPDVNAEFVKTAMFEMQQKSSDGECWQVAWNALLNSTDVTVRETLTNRNIAAKLGTTTGYYHEVYYADGYSPYILVIMTEVDGKTKDEKFMQKIADIANKLVWTYPAYKN